MTVSYSSTVATVHYNSFALLLLRWRGSVYKAVWPILMLFCSAYATVALTYHFLPHQTESDRATRRKFVQICAFAGHVSSAIPISFFLGFFVNIVVDRWWQQFLHLPTPDSVCTLLSTYLVHEPQIPGQSDKKERPLMFRRAVARYLNLSAALCFHSISLSVKRKLPTLDDFVATGLITDQELQIYKGVALDKPFFFVPLVWSVSLLTRAHHEGMIRHDRHLSALLDAVVMYWRQLHTLFLYDYVNIPLVYNQVVTLVVYLYLAILVLSQQFADPAKVLQEYDKELLSLQSACNSTANAFCGTAFLTPPPAEVGNVTRPGNSTAFMNQNNERSVSLLSALSVSPNIPVFAILSLICYAGWLRVAESHVFPFGDEDDHFETLPLMDRNFKTSLWFVDHMIQPEQLPPLLQMASVSDLAPSRGNGEAVVTQDSLNFLSPNIVNQRAMGWKRKIKRPTQLKNSGSTELPVIAITAPDDEPSIPELPCPSELRRRVSRHFFAGSMTRVYGDESSTTNPSLDPTTTNNNLRPSLPIFSTNDSLAQPVYWTGSMGMSFLGDTNPRASNSRRMFSSATTASSDPDGESTPNVVRL